MRLQDTMILKAERTMKEQNFYIPGYQNEVQESSKINSLPLRFSVQSYNWAYTGLSHNPQAQRKGVEDFNQFTLLVCAAIMTIPEGPDL